MMLPLNILCCPWRGLCTLMRFVATVTVWDWKHRNRARQSPLSLEGVLPPASGPTSPPPSALHGPGHSAWSAGGAVPSEFEVANTSEPAAEECVPPSERHCRNVFLNHHSLQPPPCPEAECRTTVRTNSPISSTQPSLRHHGGNGRT